MRDGDNVILFRSEYIQRTFIIRKRRHVVPVILQQQPYKNGREVILRDQVEFFKRNDQRQLARRRDELGKERGWSTSDRFSGHTNRNFSLYGQIMLAKRIVTPFDEIAPSFYNKTDKERGHSA